MTTPSRRHSPTASGVDYVGADAGGRHLAANLAAAEMRTLLLDADGAEGIDHYPVPTPLRNPAQCWN